MKIKYKHIQFDLVNGRWYCYTPDGETDLGQVYYDPTWKGFVWEQADNVRFSISCLKDLTSFLEQLKNPKKMQKNKGEPK